MQVLWIENILLTFPTGIHLNYHHHHHLFFYSSHDHNINMHRFLIRMGINIHLVTNISNNRSYSIDNIYNIIYAIREIKH